MNVLRISLFGKFHVQCNNQVQGGFESQKSQELFCYLLLYRDRPHHREFLAGLLWPQRTKTQSLKYLRHTLWQLQTALEASMAGNGDLLQVDSEWISLNPDAPFWLDVAAFEHIYDLVQGKKGRELDQREARLVQQALELYQGNLLEGWYQDWCLFERGRLKRTYLTLLKKQIAYCEACGEYEAGVRYGARALRHDVAHEQIHRRLMRLHYQAGDRTAALRQYEDCVDSLRQELDVDPSQRTLTLYEEIRLGHPLSSSGVGNRHKTESRLLLSTSTLQAEPVVVPENGNKTLAEMPTTLPQALQHLARLQIAFAQTQRQLEEIIQSVETVLNERNRPS
jgi:DNA-binding SARP family transcriptional activator